MFYAAADLQDGQGYTVQPVEPTFVPSNKQSKAQILWVGCSSSWIIETNVLDVAPEEIFVHRNLGNVVSYGDLSSESAIEYALDLLQVKHIVICGHYDCKLKKSEFLDGIHSWHQNPKDVFEGRNGSFKTSERTVETEKQEELHVLREVQWMKRQPHVARAIQERGLEVHGFIYDKDSMKCVRLVGAGSD